MGWRYGQNVGEGDHRTEYGFEDPDVGRPQVSSSPIEPDSSSFGGKQVLRWVFFVVFATLAALTVFHERILMRVGAYLVVSHELEQSDLIVCLSGWPIESGLTAADVYLEGLAPKIFISSEPPPDGYQAIVDHGIDVPESVDILRRILEEMGVPKDAVVESELPAWNTEEEALMVKGVVTEHILTSVIVITSPLHTRRAWLIFRGVLEQEGVAVRMHPAPYSGFLVEDWWKTRPYAREVISEYQNLIYYVIKNYL